MIYICAGHTNTKGIKYDAGAVGCGYKESELTVELRDLIVKNLSAMGATYKTDQDDWNLSDTIRGAGTTEKDVVFDIHFNAFSKSTATGTEVIIPEVSSELERKYAQEICLFVSKFLDVANRRVKKESQSQHKRLGIMRPNGVNMLWEVCFISNPEDMKKYQSKKCALAAEMATFLVRCDNEIK